MIAVVAAPVVANDGGVGWKGLGGAEAKAKGRRSGEWAREERKGGGR